MARTSAIRGRRDRLRWLRARWALLTTGARRDRGMSTAEYAVGTIAACAFAALLFRNACKRYSKSNLGGLAPHGVDLHPCDLRVSAKNPHLGDQFRRHLSP
ncbi:DUF4244 domain-containing protein [Streptosporangium sp. NBC_01755]|uniref:DUF4244 domain-containing protein n=1 Tax=Streptosporangium sp. NBC_01755 TaxID=2975949 RepID=UPI002DDB3767|nr:DUF4244 domain-containing protein [Streptosporangium sp. NBC_01755]WSD03749.1 DUF4244 domain-containing protein [Streptosporangium sp. NBC_01755]